MVAEDKAKKFYKSKKMLLDIMLVNFKQKRFVP